jgi:sugar phosphate isomerase/epimerase
MRIAFSTIACPDYGPEAMAEAVHAYGYDGVELYAAEGGVLTPSRLAERLAGYRRALRAVPIVALNSFATLGAAGSERAAQAAALSQAVELASELRCPLVKTFGGEPAGPEGIADVAARAADVLAHATARAERLGVTLAVETHDGFSCGRDLAQLLAGAPGAAALWDVHHPVRMREPPEATDAAIGARVAHVHVKDAAPSADGTSWTLVPLGEGALPFRDVLRLLAGRGFTGAVSVDYEKLWHPELAAPEESLPQHARVLREAIAAVERNSVTP